MNEAIETFIIESTLIYPINNIVTKLENNDFRSCDIKWLNDKLNKYTSFALETLGKKFILGQVGADIMNEYVKNQFINHFNTLLNYFKSF